MLARNGYLHTVDLCYQDVAASYAAAQKGYPVAIGVRQGHPGRVGMGAVNVAGGYGDRKPLFPCKLRRPAYAAVIRGHAHDACNQRLIGSVPFICLGK